MVRCFPFFGVSRWTPLLWSVVKIMGNRDFVMLKVYILPMQAAAFSLPDAGVHHQRNEGSPFQRFLVQALKNGVGRLSSFCFFFFMAQNLAVMAVSLKLGGELGKLALDSPLAPTCRNVPAGGVLPPRALRRTVLHPAGGRSSRSACWMLFAPRGRCVFRPGELISANKEKMKIRIKTGYKSRKFCANGRKPER